MNVYLTDKLARAVDVLVEEKKWYRSKGELIRLALQEFIREAHPEVWGKLGEKEAEG